MKIRTRIHAVPKKGRDFSETKSEDTFLHSELDVRPFVAVVADGHGDHADNAQTIVLAGCVAKFLLDHTSESEQRVCDDLAAFIADRFPKCESGVVATRAVIEDDRLSVAYVGDCRLYQFTPDRVSFLTRIANRWLKRRASPFVQITEDHHPDHPGEYKRLFPLVFPQNENTPFVFWPLNTEKPERIAMVQMDSSQKYRSYGLMVTRSFGDPVLRPLVISDPDVKTISFDPRKRHIFALCSDGGTAIVENVFTRAFTQPDITLDRLIELVRSYTSREPLDDTTIILIELTPTSS